MLNIMTGNITGKSKVSVGYKDNKEIERVEGDIWKENGKTWTIKNGIKRTISKMAGLRKMSHIPLSCPKCETTIRHWQDKKAYTVHGECYTCQLKREHTLRVKGTHKDYMSDKRKNNIEAWMADTEVEFKSYLENINNKSFITEAGQVEDWKTNINKDELSDKFNNTMDSIKKSIDKKED